MLPFPRFLLNPLQLGLGADHGAALAEVIQELTVIKLMVISVLLQHIDLCLLLHTVFTGFQPITASWLSSYSTVDPSVSSARSSSQHWELQSSASGHLSMPALLVSSFIVFVIIYMLKTPKLVFPEQFLPQLQICIGNLFVLYLHLGA